MSIPTASSATPANPSHSTTSRHDDSADTKSPSLSRVVLCVDDDPDYLEIVRRVVAGPRVETIGAASAEEALEIVEKQRVDAIVTDLNLPERTGIELIATLRGAGNNMPILVLTGEGSVSSAVEALKLGAADFLQKPIDGQRLRGLVMELLANGPALNGGIEPAAAFDGFKGSALDSDLRPLASAEGWFEGMLGRSAAMRQVFDAIERVAHTEAPVLISGESGSGKELVARGVHNRSNRRHGAFVPVHTGAIPKELVASELFGHERGAFTGALTAADGKFEAASRGSIFLDEVGTMVHDVQIALLRVLETMRFTRVGGRKEHVADVRVIAATNRDLLTLVQESKFREDLYFRLNVFSIVLPPLRDRREDILPLAEHYLHRFAQRYGTPARRISSAAGERLFNYAWPGNIRELRNVMERAVVFTTTGEITPATLQLVAERLPEPGQVARESARMVAHPRVYEPAPETGPGSYAAQASAGSSPHLPAAQPVGAASFGSPYGQELPPPSSPGTTYHPAPPASLSPLSPLSLSMPSASHGSIARSEPMPPAHTNSIVISLGTTIQDAEKSLILHTLEYVGGNKQKAARVLGISRRCLYNRLEEYGVMKAPAEAAHDAEQDHNDHESENEPTPEADA